MAKYQKKPKPEDSHAYQTPEKLRSTAKQLHAAASDIETWAETMERDGVPIANVGNWPTFSLALKNAFAYPNHIRTAVHEARQQLGHFGESNTPEQADTKADTSPPKTSGNQGKKPVIRTQGNKS